MKIKRIKIIRVKGSQDEFIKQFKLAREVVLREDKRLLKALAKY